MYCGQHTLVKTAPGGMERAARILYCNAWSCPDCQPKRRARLIAEANGGQPRTFLTLTMKADDTASPVEQAKRLNRAWRTLRQAICRRWKLKRLPHMTVMEATKRGTPHLHILCRAPFIPQQWISEKMGRLVGSPIIDIRRIDRHTSVAKYVAKYVGKAPHQFGTCKRYYKSRDYELREAWRQRPPLPPGFDYARLDRPLWSVVAYWQQMGWMVEAVASDRVVARRWGGERGQSRAPP